MPSPENWSSYFARLSGVILCQRMADRVGAFFTMHACTGLDRGLGDAVAADRAGAGGCATFGTRLVVDSVTLLGRFGHAVTAHLRDEQ